MASSRPKVVRPGIFSFLILDGGIVLLKILFFSPKAYQAVSARVPLPPKKILGQLLVGTAVVHAAEAAVAARSARRKGLRVAGWSLQTLAVGSPSLSKLKAQPSVRPMATLEG
jgi:Domain of unknown function (DUF4499)